MGVSMTEDRQPKDPKVPVSFTARSSIVEGFELMCELLQKDNKSALYEKFLKEGTLREMGDNPILLRKVYATMKD